MIIRLLTLPAEVASFAPMANTLWVGTRKGLFALRGIASRRDWKLVGPQFLGPVIHHVVQDPRDPKVVLLAAARVMAPGVHGCGSGEARRS